MEATELRIGNDVMGLRLGKVKSIYTSHFQVDDVDSISLGNSLQEKFEPMTLTEERLLKFGFLEVLENSFYRFFDKGDFRVFLHKSKDSIFMSWKTNTIDCTIDNLKVHQLQNLYFALEGQELTIKQ